MRTRLVAFPQEAGLVAAPCDDVPVEAVERHVRGATGEPGGVDRPVPDIKVVAHVLLVPLHTRDAEGCLQSCGDAEGCLQS